VFVDDALRRIHVRTILQEAGIQIKGVRVARQMTSPVANWRL
jgi:hypothetical protein